MLLKVTLVTGVWKQNIRRKIKRWMNNQHLVMRCGPCSTQRQSREFISGLNLVTRARLLSFNRTQSRVVIGLLTGHNTLRRHLPYILECNPHPYYSFRGLKSRMRIRIACGLDSRSSPGFWKNNRAAVRAVRTIQYNNLLFYLLFIILYNISYNIYNLLFIRLAVITHTWIVIRHPVTIIFIFIIVLP